jgi:aryl-alcohol dehydrogenase-like predicted oxidoreductase
MRHVDIGSSSLRIAPLVFGGNIFGWTVDEERSFELLDTFVDRGFNAIDTADVYARFRPGYVGGESETIIGRWLAQGGGRREKIVLCTKVGLEMGPGETGLSAAYINRAVERSLRRLQTDCIDIYFSHADDAKTPLEETLAAYDALIRAGKVRAIGASNYGAGRLEAALQTSEVRHLPRYQVLQPRYNLYDRSDYEGPLEKVAEKYALSVWPYFSLASGFLTGKYRTSADLAGRERQVFVEHYITERGRRVLSALDAVAAETQLTQAQVALAWLLSKPSVAAPIASATNLAQLDEILAAAQVVLSPQHSARLDATDTEPAEAAVPGGA